MVENTVSRPGKKEKNKSLHKHILVLASFVVGFLNWGLLISFTTFVPALLEEFTDSRSKVTVTYAVLLAISHIVGVASGVIVKKWGIYRLVLFGSVMAPLGFTLSYFATSLVMLYIFIGVIAGVGIPCVYVCAVIVIGRTFSVKRQTALLSIQNVVTGSAGILHPYVINWCIEEYSIHTTFLLTGGILLHNIAFAIIIRYSAQKYIGNADNKEITNSKFRVQVTPWSLVFVLFLIAETFTLSSLYGIYVPLLDILEFKGLSRAEGLNCLVAGNAFNTSARFLPILGELLFKDPMVSLLLSSISGLLAMLVLLYGNSFASLFVGCIFVGICDGAAVSAAATVTFHIVVPESQPFSYGLVLTTTGILSAGIGPLYGGIYDLTDSYNLVFVIAAIIFGACVLAVSLCLLIHHRSEPDIQDTRL